MNRRFFMWVDRVGRWSLAGVWCVAGVPKLLAPHQFGEVIAAYGLLPDTLVPIVAVTLPVAELVAALLLLLQRRPGLYLSAFLLSVFIAVLSYGLYLGLDIDCGCFGPEDPQHRAFTGMRLALARDLLLFLPLSYSWWHLAATSKPAGEQQ